MSNRNKNTLYSREYSGFAGVDMSSDPSQISENRLCYVQNMYRDYECGQGLAVETIPGFRRICDFGEKIYGIFRYRSALADDGSD